MTWSDRIILTVGYAGVFVSGAVLGPRMFPGFATSSTPANSLDSARQQFAAYETARFIEEEMPGIQGFPNRFMLLRHALSKVSVTDGLYCEFGVFEGGSINYIASLTPNRSIHGFDSFQGNPEDSKDFPDWKKGSFNMNGRLPKVRQNVTLHKGWFDQSLPLFAREHPEPMAFMHMDADLYSSTKTVFAVLRGRIVPGTVIVFDEFFNYPGWRRGEFKAFSELIQEHKLRFEYIGYSEGQAAVRIL